MMPKHRDSAIMPGYDLRSWANASGNKLITEPVDSGALYMGEQWRPWNGDRAQYMDEELRGNRYNRRKWRYVRWNLRNDQIR